MPLIERREAAEQVRRELVAATTCPHQRQVMVRGDASTTPLRDTALPLRDSTWDLVDHVVRSSARQSDGRIPTSDLTLACVTAEAEMSVASHVRLDQRPLSWSAEPIDAALQRDLRRYAADVVLLVYGAAAPCQCREADHYRQLVMAAGMFAQNLVRNAADRGLGPRLRRDPLASANASVSTLQRHLCSVTLTGLPG